MDNNDIKFMKLAIKEAKKAFDKGEVPIGAVLVKDNKVIAKGYNQKEHKKNATKHAEIIAIDKASKKINNWRLLKTTLYVTLEPCAMCASAIKQSRIEKVIFALEDPKNGAIINNIKLYESNDINKSPKYENGLLKNESLQLIQTFFRNKR